MGIIRTRQERLAENAKHKGQNHYKIFYKDSDGRQVQVFDFWASGNAAAFSELEIYRKKRELVDPYDTREYFYGMKGGFITDLGNGLEEEHDSMDGWITEESSFLMNVWERCSRPFFRIWNFISDTVPRICKDFAFFVRHYDTESGVSHMRRESWSLDFHMLEDLEFNLPVIKESKDGIPSEFCMKAREKLHENESGFDVRESYSKNPNSSDEELKLAETLWNSELDRLLLHIRMYRYYCDHGIIDEKDNAYVEIRKTYEKTLPYVPGTDNMLDYEKLSELTQSEWTSIWKWISDYGQNLWT